MLGNKLLIFFSLIITTEKPWNSHIGLLNCSQAQRRLHFANSEKAGHLCVAPSFESPVDDLCLRTCTVLQKAALCFTTISEPGRSLRASRVNNAECQFASSIEKQHYLTMT